MKKTLCYTCYFGLCREWEFFDDEETRRRNKCLLGNDFLEVVTSCNRYKKAEGKVTYHDPDFGKYEESFMGHVLDRVMRSEGYEKRTGYSCPNCGEPVNDPIGGEKQSCPKCGYPDDDGGGG